MMKTTTNKKGQNKTSNEIKKMQHSLENSQKYRSNKHMKNECKLLDARNCHGPVFSFCFFHEVTTQYSVGDKWIKEKNIDESDEISRAYSHLSR